jgi:aspartyl-tRNA(Asn)/glutamyl-tRNA(Gln) amidotransferase subunit B
MSLRDKYQPVIGLEVHCQLSTNTKAFVSDSAEFGDMPNMNVSVITLAHPGALPKANKKAVEFSIKIGVACGSEISRYNEYARKNYFYPDLPKGYQITQDKHPICVGGTVKIKLSDGSYRNVQLNRIHMEEDAGKSIHMDAETDTLVDYNRAGVPLIEMVSEPDIFNSDEAYQFLTEIRKLVRYLEICDGNMEEGSMRCDANISVMLKGSKTLGKKVEVKNMNSIRNVQRAIEHEIDRQIALVEAGVDIPSESRTYDAGLDKTFSMRSKEEMNDYRYFPEPDLQPIIVSEEWLTKLKSEMPPLPNELLDKFQNQYGLPEYDAYVLTDSKDIALFFERICASTKSYKAASNWVMGPVKSFLNELTLHIKDYPVSPEKLAELIELVDSRKVSHTVAQQSIYPELLITPTKSPLQIAKELNLLQDSNEDSLLPIIKEVLAEMPAKVVEYRSGKKGLLGLFMGEVMKRSKGKADPKLASELVAKELEG